MKKLVIAMVLIGWVLLSSFFRSYPSEVTSVYDGDTITLTVYLGFGITKTEKIRLDGIDAPEVRGSERYEGIKSRDALRTKILHKQVRLETLKNDKKGKYGRTIGIIWLEDENINNWLVVNDYAEVKVY
jgi:micrococcal nuclease